MTFEFKPAVREQVSILVALAGASGSGKTFTALRLAQGMSPSGKIAFIDTEARRGLHYAEQFAFLHHDMRPPFSPARMVEAIHAAEATGAEVVIIDSMSHEYDGVGGIVDMADRLAEGTPKPGIERPREKYDGPDWWKDWAEKPVESPGNWKVPKLAHKQMMNVLLQCRASLIFCLRADEKIEIAKDEKGKTIVRPLGWMPICEKRFPYEMTASFTLTPEQPGIPRYDLPHKLQQQHRAMFAEGRHIDQEAGRLLAEWARGGTTAPASAPINAPSDTDGRVAELTFAGDEYAREGMVPLGEWWKALSPADKRLVGGADKIAEWKRAAGASAAA